MFNPFKKKKKLDETQKAIEAQKVSPVQKDEVYMNVHGYYYSIVTSVVILDEKLNKFDWDFGNVEYVSLPIKPDEKICRGTLSIKYFIDNFAKVDEKETKKWQEHFKNPKQYWDDLEIEIKQKQLEIFNANKEIINKYTIENKAFFILALDKNKASIEKIGEYAVEKGYTPCGLVLSGDIISISFYLKK